MNTQVILGSAMLALFCCIGIILISWKAKGIVKFFREIKPTFKWIGVGVIMYVLLIVGIGLVTDSWS